MHSVLHPARIITALCLGLTLVGAAPARAADYAVPMRLPALGTDEARLRPDAKGGQPHVVVTTERYRFGAHTARTIYSGHDGMKTRARQAGLSRLGRTQWRIKWTYSYRRRLGRCTLTDVNTVLSVRYHLPEWRPSERAAPALRRHWETFSQGLDVHEYGHALIGYRAAQDIDAALQSSTDSDKNCDTLGERMNAVARARLDVARAQGRAYDAQTQHGRTQGAWFKTKDIR